MLMQVFHLTRPLVSKLVAVPMHRDDLKTEQGEDEVHVKATQRTRVHGRRRLRCFLPC